MSCSGSHLGIPVNIKHTKFVKDLPMIDAQFRIRNPRWLPPQVIVLTQDHMGKYRNIFFSETIALIEPKLCINHWKVLYKQCNQRPLRACIVHLVIKRNYWSYVKTMSCSGSHLGIPINIKNA
jgi:hypothetical protein